MAAMLKTVAILISLGVAVSATLSVIPIEIQPDRDEAVVFLCSSDAPLQSCLMKPPNSNTWLSMSNSDNLFARVGAVNRGDRYLYYGEGLRKGDCGLVIPFPKQEDSGAWLCKTQAVGDPVSITEEVTVHIQGRIEQLAILKSKLSTSQRMTSLTENDVVAPEQIVKAEENETKLMMVPVDIDPEEDESVVFICQMNKPIEICEMQPPNSEEWISLNNSGLLEKDRSLKKGERYLYYGDGLVKGDCGIVIPRPQADDSGVWKCKAKAVGESTYLNDKVEVKVAGSKLTLIPIEVQPQADESVVFVCQLDKPIQSCQIQAPGSEEWIEFSNKDLLEKKTNFENGDRYLYYGDGLDKGDCGIVIPKPQPEDNGLWKCKTQALGDPLPLSEVVDVVVIGTKLNVVPVDVQPDKDESVVFICQLNKPVDICQMQPPNSKEWISLKNSDVRVKNNRLEIGDRYLYYGEGLEKGDCGIVIPNPKPIDNGMWTCKTKAVGEPVFISSRVKVNVPGKIMKLNESGVNEIEDANLNLEDIDAKGNISWIMFVYILGGSLTVLLFGIAFVAFFKGFEKNGAIMSRLYRQKSKIIYEQVQPNTVTVKTQTVCIV